MGHYPSRKFDNIAPDQVAAITVALNRQGARIIVKSDSSFEVNGMGIVADANYESERQSLTVVLIHKPMLTPEDFIFGKIQDAIDAIPAKASEVEK